MTGSTPKIKRPGEDCHPAEPVSSNPHEGKAMNSQEYIISRPSAAMSKNLSRVMAVIEDTHHLIHAAWMAAGSLDREDHGAEQDALRSVLHLAGERLNEASIAIEREQHGRSA